MHCFSVDSVQALALSLVHAGPIMLYNAYQSSNYDVKTHPAEAAIDGNIYTSSQTAVDTSGCKALNDDGLYGICGVLAECMTSPYYTGAYASTPSNPYWTAGFTSDISVRSEGFFRPITITAQTSIACALLKCRPCFSRFGQLMGMSCFASTTARTGETLRMGSLSRSCILLLLSCLLGRVRLLLGTHSHMHLSPDQSVLS